MRKIANILGLIMVLISCEKTPVPEYRDELLSQVSGKYQLVEFLWEGDPIDINNDGEKTCDLLKEFRQWGGFEDNWYRLQERFGRMEVVYSLLIILTIKGFILRIKKSNL